MTTILADARANPPDLRRESDPVGSEAGTYVKCAGNDAIPGRVPPTFLRGSTTDIAPNAFTVN